MLLCLSAPTGAPSAATGAADTVQEVREVVSAWRLAWQDMDLERYLSFYGESFLAAAPDRRRWLENKTRIFNRPGPIQIEISDLRSAIAEDRAVVTFVQHYRGPRHSDVGNKKLILQREDGNWRIVEEEWSPLEAPSAETPRPSAHRPEKLPTAAAQAAPLPRQEAASELAPFTLGLWTGPHSEHVCIRLNRPFEPKVTPEDPKARRIQIDIPGVQMWIGPDLVFDGRWVHQITTWVDTRNGALHATLELEPDSQCIVEPVYIESHHLFCLDFVLPARATPLREGDKTSVAP